MQDGFDLFLHRFIVTDDARWVVQQGMNGESRLARRYHWLSEGLQNFVEAPHSAIDGKNQGGRHRVGGNLYAGAEALMDRTSGARKARWISFYTASFSLGTSGSFLITGAMAGAFGWRAAFGLATAAAAFLLVAFGLPPVKPVPPRRKSHPFDFGSVLRNRAAMGYVLGYSAHAWELFGARS